MRMKLPILKKRKFFKSRWGILLCLAVGLMGIILIFPNAWSRVKQPLAFNHKIHAKNDLKCLDCHIYYEKQASSGEPRLAICAGCHEEPVGKSEKEKIVVEHVKSGREFEWQRLYRIPEDVYFSHRRHAVLEKIECEFCHGDIGQSDKPPSRPLKKMTMKKCLSCHQEKKAATDCISCHR
jgi:hypothetical protein